MAGFSSGNGLQTFDHIQSVFAALREPVSRTHYDRTMRSANVHNQVLIVLAQRRCDVVFANLRDGTLHQADYVVIA